MRILHVVPTYIPAWRYGGPIHSVHGLARALAALGHRVDVATTSVDGDGDSDVPLGTAVDLDGVNVHYFPSARMRRLYYSPPLRRFLAERIAASWDMVHTHSVFLWPTAVAAQLARRAGKPYVLSPRGMLVPGLIARRSTVAKRAWIAAFERRNVEGAAAVHVTSASEAEALRGAGFRPRRILEVPNGVDPPGSTAAGDAPPGLPARYALFLGRMSWKKGLDRLVDALAGAAGLELVVAGNDEEDLWPGIARRAESLGVAARVRHVGFVEGAAKAALVSRALMLVLPSRSENFGNVVLEAMALGTPVVVTPEVGLAPLVARSESGIVTPAEREPLARSLALLAGDEALRSRMGRNARAAAAAFGWPAIARRFEDEYARLLAEPAAAAAR